MMTNYAKETLRAALHALSPRELTCLSSACPDARRNFHKTIRDAWGYFDAFKDEASSRYRDTHLRKLQTGFDEHYIACTNGGIGRLKYFHSINVRLPIDQYRDLLNLACYGGNVKFLKCLHKLYNMTVEHFQDGLYFGFTELPIIKYLHTGMGMTVEDMRAQNHYETCLVCWGKHDLETVKYLCAEVGIPPEDIRAHVAKNHCSPEEAEYFKKEFGIF